MEIKALQVKRFPIYDIFFGSGWEGWSRVLIERKNKAIVLGGNQLPHHQLSLLIEQAPILAQQSRQAFKNVYSPPCYITRSVVK